MTYGLRNRRYPSPVTPALEVEPWLRARIAEALVAEGCPSKAATALAEEAYFEEGTRGGWMLRLWRCGVTVPWPITEASITESVGELAGNVVDHNEEQHDQRLGEPRWSLRDGHRPERFS